VLRKTYIFALTLKVASFGHAFDKHTAHGFNEVRRRRDVPRMARVKKLGS
jgi:hypothetical protein